MQKTVSTESWFRSTAQVSVQQEYFSFPTFTLCRSDGC